jgi:hypothetical protein
MLKARRIWVIFLSTRTGVAELVAAELVAASAIAPPLM